MQTILWKRRQWTPKTFLHQCCMVGWRHHSSCWPKKPKAETHFKRKRGRQDDSHKKNCITVCAFKDGLACATEDSTLYVFNNSLDLQNLFSSVITLLTCHSQSLNVFWISGLTKICKLRGNNVKEIEIHYTNTQSNLCVPMIGHVLLKRAAY